MTTIIGTGEVGALHSREELEEMQRLPLQRKIQITTARIIEWYCQVCGWDKEIEIVDDDRGKLIWKCPNCGNTDKSKMNIARRTCGYIGLNDWNQGRTQEIKERYVHLGGDE